jgi:hypothetical protein
VQGSEKMKGKRDQEPAKNNDHCELWFNKITGGQAPWQAIHGYEKFSLKSYGPERPAKKVTRAGTCFPPPQEQDKADLFTAPTYARPCRR